MKIIFLIIVLLFLVYCSDYKNSNQPKLSEFEIKHGIGPVKEKVVLNKIDITNVKQGRIIFQKKCSSCHRLDTKLIGPPLKDVIEKRSTEYILNMIVNPVDMTLYHPIAKKMAIEYGSQMTFQNVNLTDAFKILDFLRYENSIKNNTDNSIH